jgi:hypothetical protein
LLFHAFNAGKFFAGSLLPASIATAAGADTASLPRQWSYLAASTLVYYILDWCRDHKKSLVILALALYGAIYFQNGGPLPLFG